MWDGGFGGGFGDGSGGGAWRGSRCWMSRPLLVGVPIFLLGYIRKYYIFADCKMKHSTL
jgi:hypothetical protein